MKLNASQLRTASQDEVKPLVERNPIYFILENIYDTYNVGGIFRLADALNVEKIYLCGQTEVPPNSKIKKASIGTYKIVPWEYKTTAKEAVEDIKSKLKTQKSKKKLQATSYKLQVIAVEQDKRSIPYTQIDYKSPVALLVGNETYGVLPETLDLVDQIAEIPMWGINKSLNVIVSAAIVAYHVMGK